MGSTTISQPVNPYQITQALGQPFTARADDEAGAVEVEAPGISDNDLASLLAGIVYDPAAAPVEQVNASVIDQAITDALAELRTLVAAPAVADVPAGTMTTAQLSNAVRSMRDVVQQNRTGAQKVAQTLKQTIRLVRGDFDDID